MNEDLLDKRIAELFVQLCSLNCGCEDCLDIHAEIDELTEAAFGPAAL